MKTQNNFPNLIQLFLSKRMLIVLLLGFSSGLPLALTGATLQAWYTTAGVSLVGIGFLTLVGQPYVYKFIWAPLMDRFVPPLLGRRRGWILLMQASLIVTIALLAFLSPVNHPLAIALIALVIAFLSASQDIAIDAYRTDFLKEEELGPGSSMFVGGYRIAMLISGGVALILAQLLGWHTTYLLMSAMMLIGVVAAWFGPEVADDNNRVPHSLKLAVVEPFKEFMSRNGAVTILLFIIVYKLGDAFALSLSSTFLIRDLGFSLADVGSVYKGFGLVATLLGIFIGGGLLTRLGLFRGLFLFGIFQGVSNLAFMALAIVGKSFPMLVGTIFIENITGGMATAAFLALLMTLCDKRYTATQFALLSGLSAVGRVFVGPVAAYAVKYFGWADFFFISSLVAIPGLYLLYLLRRQPAFASVTPIID